MKKQIRKCVFETNSSSTHSICISKDPIILENIDTKHVCFSSGEFGWEFATYSDLLSKASYLYEAICAVYPEEEKRSEVLNTLYNMLSHYGIECTFLPKKKDSWGFEEGYIDHGSETSDFVNAVLHNENRLLRYLFGNSFVKTGNDNCDYEDDGSNISNSDYEIYYKGN